MRMNFGRSTAGASGISSSYDNSKKIQVDLGFSPRTSVFLAKISLIQILCSNLSADSTPTKITVSFSEDPNGDHMMLTETVTTLQTGRTTATRATGLIRMDVIATMSQDYTDNVYIFAKSDQGTLDIDTVTITWEAP